LHADSSPACSALAGSAPSVLCRDVAAVHLCGVRRPGNWRIYPIKEPNMADIKPVLEPAAEEFADATANPPFLFDLPVAEGRKTVDSVQDGDVSAPAVDVTDHL